jgi:acetylornithine deacetylase/succinyl-diaminopimelate desuccinylase-like protein
MPIEHDMEHPHMKAFMASIEQHAGITPRGVLSYAASDANAFVERGLACMLTYPIGSGHHSEEEWIDAKGLEALPKIVAGYLQQAAKVKSDSLVAQELVER